jgi:hypothetical protein
MKKIISLILFAGSAVLLNSCLKDKLTKTYKILEPVYKSKTEVLANIKSSSPASLKNTGKIYLYNNYIFLNEINKGVHIIDNTNPSSPVTKAFISIPGNVDIAVKGNILYADLYTDMMVIDITDPLNARLLKAVPNIFPERFYGNGFVADSTKVIVDWVEKEITEEADAPLINRGWISFNAAIQSDASSLKNAAGAVLPGIGIGGSMARFAIINDYMYAVNQSSLDVLSLTNPSDPLVISSKSVGWNIETIYPFKQKLFIGSSTGMFIFSIANPALPVYESGFSHARACDPVVADDNYAYVTLRAGNFCQGTNNELDVINIQNLQAPVLVKRYNLTNPFGLAKDGNLLFVCDGKDGLKIYDAADVQNLQLIKHISGIETYDVIAWNKKLIVVAKDGLIQYDYASVNNIFQLSKIKVSR